MHLSTAMKPLQASPSLFRFFSSHKKIGRPNNLTHTYFVVLGFEHHPSSGFHRLKLILKDEIFFHLSARPSSLPPSKQTSREISSLPILPCPRYPSVPYQAPIHLIKGFGTVLFLKIHLCLVFPGRRLLKDVYEGSTCQ